MKSQIINYSFMILLLAAHFSRAGNEILALVTLGIPLLLFVKKSWVINVLQVVGYLAALVWIYGAYQYIQLRIEVGVGWTRLLLIMGTVALYSAWSGFILRSEEVKKKYGITK